MRPHQPTLVARRTPPPEAAAALADAALACWESKYFYEFWRPVTAIREGNRDGNLGTAGDPDFVPLGAPASNVESGPNFTPPFPAYTSGHATFGGAVFQMLRRFYGTNNIQFTFVSDEFNGVTRDNLGNVRPRRASASQTTCCSGRSCE